MRHCQIPTYVLCIALVACDAEVERPGGASATSAGGSPSSGGGGHTAGGGGAGGADLPPCVPATSDVFDPGEVYMAGTVEVDDIDRVVIAHWCDANSVVAGFEAGFGPVATIRPADGRLIYPEVSSRSTPQVYEFRCDACPFDGGEYPPAPLANDIHIPDSTCGEYDYFLVAPDGDIITRCEDTQVYYDAAGNAVYPLPDSLDPELLHLGPGGLGLTRQEVVDLVAGTTTPIVGLPEGELFARASDDAGFLVAVETEEGRKVSLHSVLADGSTTLLGTYPEAPSVGFMGYTSLRVDAHRAVFQVGHKEGPSRYVIVRRDLSGSSAIVYDEADDPLAKIGLLLTGP
jgi:hypothetical protein